MSSENLPFKGLVVLELATVLAGPSVGMFFAELGARVIKVENPFGGGDVTRSWKTPSEDRETDLSAYFLSTNWGKESIGLNLAEKAGKELLYRLVEKSDILIANYKPGDAEKLAMDYNTLQKVNPKLIYASLTAYGDDNNRPGFDAIIQAESGFMYMNGTPESGPVKMPVALMDVLAAHQLKEAILIALLERAKTGKGSQVEASLIGSGISALVNQATNWLQAGKDPQRIGSSHPNIVPYGNVFKTADDQYIVLAIGSDKHFQRLCSILTLSHLATDPRFSTNPDRVKNRKEILEILNTEILKWTRDELLQSLHDQKVPAGAIRRVSEVFETNPGKKLSLSGKSTKKAMPIKGISQIAFKHSATSIQKPESAPMAFEHTDQILKEDLHLTPEEIEHHKQTGTIK